MVVHMPLQTSKFNLTSKLEETMKKYDRCHGALLLS